MSKMRKEGRTIVLPINDDGTVTIGDFICRYDPNGRTVWVNGPQQSDPLTMAVRAIGAILKVANPAN